MKVICPVCGGDGIYGEVNPCPACGEDGKIDLTDNAFKHVRGTNRRLLMGVIWDKLLTNTTMPTNVFESYKILECLDPTEHAALTVTKKDGVRILLSCGLVDLNDGKAGKVRLWNWFGAESDTVANLTALLA